MVERFGIIKIFVTNPPNKLPFVTPTLKVSSGISWQGKVPCAPANVSNVRFYDSLAGPTWHLNFIDYGHADILDDWVNKYLYIFMMNSYWVRDDFAKLLKVQNFKIFKTSTATNLSLKKCSILPKLFFSKIYF